VQAIDYGNVYRVIHVVSRFMAKVLSTVIQPGKDLEIGMTSVRLTLEANQDSVFGILPCAFNVFEWYRERRDLPKDCVPLQVR